MLKLLHFLTVFIAKVCIVNWLFSHKQPPSLSLKLSRIIIFLTSGGTSLSKWPQKNLISLARFFWASDSSNTCQIRKVISEKKGQIWKRYNSEAYKVLWTQFWQFLVIWTLTNLDQAIRLNSLKNWACKGWFQVSRNCMFCKMKIEKKNFGSRYTILADSKTWDLPFTGSIY